MIIVINTGLKLSYRNNLDQPEFECLDDCVKVMTESQIEEFGCITDTCEKRRRRSYGYISDTTTDTGPTARTAINFGSVSRCMASKYNDGKTGHQLSANYTMEDDCDAGSGGERGGVGVRGERGGEGVTVTYPVNGCGIKREVPSSSSNNNDNNNSSNSSSNNNTSNNSNNNSSSSSSSISSSNLHFDQNSVNGIHQSQQNGSQRSVRLQNNPSQPLFPRSKTDATNNNNNTNTLGKNLTQSDQINPNIGSSNVNNIHINENNGNGNSGNNGNGNNSTGNNGNGSSSSMLSLTPAPKKIFCPIQSRIVDLINLCKNNILGAGTGSGSGTGLNGGSSGVGLLTGGGTGNGMGSNSHNNHSNHRITAQHTHTQAHSSSNNNNNNNNNSNCSYHSNNNGGELLQISDEEMLNFPKLFTDAFNIGDYEGVSTVSY